MLCKCVVLEGVLEFGEHVLEARVESLPELGHRGADPVVLECLSDLLVGESPILSLALGIHRKECCRELTQFPLRELLPIVRDRDWLNLEVSLPCPPLLHELGELLRA